MIQVITHNKSIRVSVNGSNAFTDVINTLKSNKCRFDPSRKDWIIPHHKYDAIMNQLEDLDTIDMTLYDEEEVKRITQSDPELTIAKERRIFDQSLLRLPPIKGKPAYENFQRQDIVRAINRNRYGMFLDMGLGKFQPLDALIQSPTGPIRMGDIQVGDHIFDTNGGISEVLQIHPQGVQEVVTLVLSDGAEVKAGLDHLWTIYDAQDHYSEKVLTTQQIIDGIAHQKTLKGINSTYSRYKLPEIDPVAYPKQSLPIPPYALGALIGDGSISQTVGLVCSPRDIEILERCQALLSPFEVVPSGPRRMIYTFVSNTPAGQKQNRLKDALHSLGLLGTKSSTKFIPITYLRSSVEDRIELLRGLMDTDGTISSTGSMFQIGFSNEQLIYQVRELVESLGGRSTNIRSYFPRTNMTAELEGQEHFNMTFKLPSSIIPFHLTRKAARISPKSRGSFRYIADYRQDGSQEECQCITVSAPNALYLTDHFIPTHNSYYKAAIIAHLRKLGLAHKVLLISSNIGASNMVHELKKFMYIDPSEIICMTKAGKDRELFKADKTIAITNYNTFKFVCDYYYKEKNGKKPTSKKYRAPVLPLEEWFDGKPGILLLDESHNIGNPRSQQTARIMQHAPYFEYRYLFSGTPADKPEKLYTQLKVLDDALVDGLSYVDWLDEYAELGTRFSAYAIREWKYDKIEALNKRVEQTYGIFRKSEDVLDLPENYIKKMYLELDRNHRDIYEAFVINTLDNIRERTGGLLTRDIINSFPYLQMALDNPNMLLNHEELLTDELLGMIKRFDFGAHTKSNVLQDILSEHVDEKKEKGIIWIYHPDTAHRLQQVYAKYNPLIIIGETEDREEILRKFRTDDTHKILIASIPILNTSVTLVEAKFQVYFERVYNYNQYSQSLKRISRIGQDRRTITYILIFDTTVDVALDVNLTHKDTLNTKILSKEFLTQDEWKEIFNLTETSSWAL